MPDLPRVGEEFAGYRLVSRLGQGGMSVVYRAENWRLGNVVALKLLAPDLASDDTFRTRFLQESRIAAALTHPNVVPIIDYGACDGLLFIAMRYVAGTDLRQLLESRGRLAPDYAVHLLGQAALALDAAHRRGLVHRDVKPGNLLLERTSDDADPDHLYLADFGITKNMTELAGLTSPGQVPYTSRYVSPEQIREQAVLGTADQYALGCVLYECLTGHVPFEQDSWLALSYAHVAEDPPPATLLRPELPSAVDQVFARALAKDPGDRYATCRDFVTAAGQALGLTPGWPLGSATREFRSAPPGGFPGAVADPAGPTDDATASLDLPVMEPLPGGWRPPDAPPRRRRVRRLRGRRAPLIAGVIALVILAAAAGVITSRVLTARAPVSASPAAQAVPSASALFSALEKTAGLYPGDLRLSACRQVSATNVQCGNTSPVIAKVTFATYPSLAALYAEYQEILHNLTHQPFAALQNLRACGPGAPGPTGESSWNQAGQEPATYSIDQLASGQIPAGRAAGRVFCGRNAGGSAVIVWTQDSGRLLGYATGADVSFSRVWSWFTDIHRHITFPAAPATFGVSLSPSPR
jgi:protein kinase-like protein